MQARQDAGHTAQTIDDGTQERPVFRALDRHYAGNENGICWNHSAHHRRDQRHRCRDRAAPKTMTATPQHGSASSAARDVANLGFVRPPFVYLVSLVSGTLIHIIVPLPFLPDTLAVPLGVLFVAVAIT